MPLPVIPILVIAASSAAAAIGIGKGSKGVQKNIKAKNVNKEAVELLNKAQSAAISAANNSEGRLNALGKRKLDVLDKSVNRFVDVFDKIHNIELQKSVGLDELEQYRIDKHAALELRNMSVLAGETLGGVAGGAGAGALLAFGAYGTAATFGTASTGTAIATLSGIVAKNATLAWLGGGAVAAGGGGMALGAVVLGGLVAGPALAIIGITVDASASKNLDKALSNKAEAKLVAEELKIAKTLCNGIAKRAHMFDMLLVKLNNIFEPLILQLESIVSSSGVDYSKYNETEQNQVAMAMSIAGAIKKVLDTPIICKDGKLTQESEETHRSISNHLKTFSSQ